MSGSERPSFSGALAVGRKVGSASTRQARRSGRLRPGRSGKSQPWLFNHVMRSWLYGAKLAQRRGARSGWPNWLQWRCFCTISALAPRRCSRSSLRGCGARTIGRAFALTHDMGERRAEAVWDSIALPHHPVDCASIRAPTWPAVRNGIACDYGGLGLSTPE